MWTMDSSTLSSFFAHCHSVNWDNVSARLTLSSERNSPRHIFSSRGLTTPHFYSIIRIFIILQLCVNLAYGLNLIPARSWPLNDSAICLNIQSEYVLAWSEIYTNDGVNSSFQWGKSHFHVHFNSSWMRAGKIKRENIYPLIIIGSANSLQPHWNSLSHLPKSEYWFWKKSKGKYLLMTIGSESFWINNKN